jgi:serine/threonine protein kinase
MTATEYGNLSRAEPSRSLAPELVDLPLLARNGFHHGELIGGKYRVTGLIGEGGMGIVLAAVHDDLERDVAIKVVRHELLQNDDVIERLLTEAQIAACIRSEHVTRVLDVGRLANGSPYLVLERLEGRDLAGILDESGPLELATAVDFVLQVCDALAEAHAGGIVHRDLKPENLFFTTRPDGSACIKVLDFGISKNLSARDRRGAITSPSQVMGSPYYMAPEQIRSKPVDARSDIWALGVVLYELCTGQTPFAADSVPSVCHLVLNEEPTPPRTFAPDLPLALEAVILRCLEKDPARRYGNVAELAAALSPFGGPEAAYYAERIERVLRVTGSSGAKLSSTIAKLSSKDLGRRKTPRCPDVRVVVDDSRPDLKTQPSAEFPRSFSSSWSSSFGGRRAAQGSAATERSRLAFMRPAIYVGLAVGIALGAGIALGSTQALPAPATRVAEPSPPEVPVTVASVAPAAEPVTSPIRELPVLASATATAAVSATATAPRPRVEKPVRSATASASAAASASAQKRLNAWDRKNFGGRR